MKKNIVTSWMIFLWVLIFPISILTNFSNCWYWSLWKKFTQGGKMIPIPSKRWSGHHWVWEDKNKVQWEYTTKRKLPKFSPWWTLVVYKGYSRKFRDIQKIEGKI